MARTKHKQNIAITGCAADGPDEQAEDEDVRQHGLATASGSTSGSQPCAASSVAALTCI